MSGEKREYELSTSAINLRKLVSLRFFTIIFFSVLLAVTILGLGIKLPVWGLAAVLVAMTSVSAFTMLYLHLGGSVGERVLFGHLVLDVGALTALFYLSGGWTNPFVSLYLLPIALTATVVPGRFTWIMVALTASCYTLLVFWHIPLPVSHDPAGSGFNLHVIGMWMGFLLASLAIAFFVVRMAATLRERDRELSLMHESTMRNEQVVALATLATGAAHELGTPLGTMAILLNEIKAEQPLTHDQLEILQTQIRRCKEILGSVAASAGVARADAGEQVPLDEFLNDVVKQWLVIRPRAEVRMSLDEGLPAPRIVADRTLSQAIMNILNNAAEASAGTIDISATWREDTLKLEVADQGSGLSPEVLKNKGQPFVTTKSSSQGLGLGLFLVQATMDRLGGRMEFIDREGGGTICRLELPLAPLLVDGKTA